MTALLLLMAVLQVIALTALLSYRAGRRKGRAEMEAEAIALLAPLADASEELAKTVEAVAALNDLADRGLVEIRETARWN
jgi:hypothetical protein